MPDSLQTEATNDLSAVALATLGRAEADTITDMLACIARRFDAFGCGLWEVAPNADLKADPPRGFLLTVATWWKSGQLFALDDVPLDDSPTARAAIEQTPVIIRDVRKEGGAKKAHPFWRENRIGPMCAVPLVFLDGSFGAINIYREERQPAFTAKEQERLMTIAQVAPGLYRAVREKIALRLVRDVEEMLREAESEKQGRGRRTRRRPRLKMTEVKEVLRRVCERVARAFDCVETSLFLEGDFVEGDREYRCLATTQKKCVTRNSYRVMRDSGRFTGWVLANEKPIWVHDLARVESYRAFLESEFGGLEERDPAEDTRHAHRLLKIERKAPLPPLSLMAVPVFGAKDWLYGGTDLRGVLRCHMARSGPFYFSLREAERLSVVAAQVGEWWARWRTGEEMAQEIESWNAMVRHLGELNEFARSELKQPDPDERKIFQEALRVASDVIPGAVFNSIRLYDNETEELRFVEFSEAARIELRRSTAPKTALAPERVTPESKSAGAKVFRTGESAILRDATHRRHYVPIFPQVQQIVIVPIAAAGENVGLLDLRWTNRPIPAFAAQAAQMLGQQLGIYHQLLLLVKEQRAAVARAERQQREEARAYEDFGHQMKSPIMQAMLRMQTTLELSRSPEEQRRLLVVRGLIRRASRVAMSMRLLAELSHDRPIVSKPTGIDRNVLLKKLIELADDTQLHAQGRRISFAVVRETFKISLFPHLAADLDLLEQMISNLLDNAAKYSFPDTTVRIEAGLTRSKRVFLAVINRGLHFGAGETEKCKRRGYRSSQARLTATEGQGIGLWLVDQIMQAHGGELLIQSPNPQGETEVRLVFSEAHGHPNK
jgi:signal transduction histidine kinase